MDVSELFLLGRRLEARFGVPQDIEWAYSGGRFLLLQSRDITRTQLDNAEAAPARLEAERERLAVMAAVDPGMSPALAQNELSELLPRPSPVALDLMASLWASGGGVDRACRAIGLRYAVEEDSPALLATAYGRLYVDKTEERKRTLKLSWVGARRLDRAASDIERDFSAQFLPKFNEQVRLLEAVDYSRLTVPEQQNQLERVRMSFVTETCAQVEIVNIAANFYLERAKAALAARGLNAANYLGDLEETPIAHALAAAHMKEAVEERIDAFLHSFGHRATLDYELAQPRYAEDRALVAALVGTGPALHANEHAAKAPTDHNWQDDKLRTVVERARRFQILKERAKHEALREIALMRRILLALDRALGLEGGVFHLKFAEIAGLADNGAIAEAQATIGRRRAQAELFTEVLPLPTELDLHLLETVSLTDSPPAQAGTDALSGTLVSSGAPVTGRARAVSPQAAERGDPIDGFADGDIIVSRMIHAAWLPYFCRAGGLVCEVGGWLSHIAILAREYNLPLVIGVAGIATIKTGEALQIEVDGRVVRVAGAGLPPVAMPTLPSLAPPAEDNSSYAAAAQ
jgi:phosphohistidine swiveling domain-containing protein